MSLSDVLRLLARKWLLLVLVPVVLGVSTYFFARHLPKSYGSDTTIYTGIASGYSLTGNVEADLNATNNAFDNLINLATARSTKEEVIYQLLATHLWQTNQQPALLNTLPYEDLREGLPADVRRQLTGPSLLATQQLVRHYAQANNSNAVYELLNSYNPTYSLSALSNLRATRVGLSDLLRLDYESYNPEICRYTLELVTQTFLGQSKGLRERQTTSVIQYYEAELKRAKARLEKAESENLAFNRDNNIVDYEAQVSNIAAEKEALATALNQVSQEYAGSLAALKAINKRLGGQEVALLNSRQIVEQRQKLSRLNAAIADEQLFNQQQEAGTGAKPRQLQQLQAEADKAARAIQNNVDIYFAHSTSPEGVPSQDLLTAWVQDMVLVESNRAKLDVMRKREAEFEREYGRMAPLGATLKRIEREIALAEKAYLDILSSLNTSKASEQNTQISANLKIIDPPNLPLKPRTSKVLMLVLLSFVSGFVFMLGSVLTMGLLDKSLKKPQIAARQIGLPVAGMMLDTNTAPTEQFQTSQQRQIDRLVRHVLLKANTPPAASPFVLGVFSVQHQEGKTTLCQALTQRCQEMGIQTLTLYPNSNQIEKPNAAPALFYAPETAAVHGWQLDELIRQAAPKQTAKNNPSDASPRIVLIEFPALREEALPVGVLQQLSLIFLTVPATRPWHLTDRQALEQLKTATPAPIEVVLAGVAPYYSEEALS
ncbi:GumC family protein [Hymenobacter terrenus]|uniref:GumC family protein n=1 Tax=Hymenobacter terrenus TaxID=1629124 RepID=UPI00061943AB|nr:hypothetical protein [Hymenobacter terrenus]